MANEAPRTGEATTTNYGWVKPTVGASTDAWGGYINTDLDGIDSAVHNIQTSLSGYLPLSGGGLTGSLAINATSPALTLNATAGSNYRSIIFTTAGSQRWDLFVDNSAEGGIAAGSNLQINTSDNTGTYLGTPLSITRSSGFVAINPTAAQGAQGAQLSLSGANASYRSLVFTTGSVTTSTALRWNMYVNGVSEAGGNVGSDFGWNSYTDAGAYLATPLVIKRSTGVATFSAAIVNGPSDRTLKENITPLDGALDRVLQLQGVSFNMIATPDKPEIGLIAQDVEPIVPEVLQSYATFDSAGKAAGDKLALDYPKLTALLIEAVKTLAARVAELEAVR